MKKSFILYSCFLAIVFMRTVKLTDLCVYCSCAKDFTVNCTNNSFTSFPNVISNIRHLDISHNEINVLQPGTFQNLSKLYSLNISYNFIKQVPGYIFRDMFVLHTLDLSGNFLNSIYNDSFAGLHKLTTLILNNLQYLTIIHSGAFDDLHNLKYLSLTNNKRLITLESLLFPLNRLEFLDISNNSLETLTLNSTQILDSAKLSNNKWTCDCRFKKQLQISDVPTKFAKDLSSDFNIQFQKSTIHPFSFALPSHKSFICSTPKDYKYVPVLHILSLIQCYPDNGSSDKFFATAHTSLNNSSFGTRNHSYNNHSSKHTHVIKHGKSHEKVEKDKLKSINNGLIAFNDAFTETIVIDFCYNYSLPIPSTNFNQSQCMWTKEKRDGEYEVYDDYDKHDDVSINENATLSLRVVSKKTLGSYYYFCYKAHNETTRGVYVLMHRYELMFGVEWMSVLVGVLSSLAFFTVSLLYGSLRWCCFKCSKEEKQTRSSFREVLSSMRSTNFRSYKVAQLEKLSAFRSATFEQLSAFRLARVNKLRTYKQATVNSILHCMDQLREHYTTKTNKIKDNCQAQFDRLKENYAGQKMKFKDSKSQQLKKIRHNYNQQADKIKDYSTQQLSRLRDQYKHQQQNLLRLLELLELKNCLTDIREDCSRTESAIFDSDMATPEIQILPFFNDQLDENFVLPDTNADDTDNDADDIADLDVEAMFSECESIESSSLNIDFDAEFCDKKKKIQRKMEKNKKSYEKDVEKGKKLKKTLLQKGEEAGKIDGVEGGDTGKAGSGCEIGKINEKQVNEEKAKKASTKTKIKEKKADKAKSKKEKLKAEKIKKEEVASDKKQKKSAKKDVHSADTVLRTVILPQRAEENSEKTLSTDCV